MTLSREERTRLVELLMQAADAERALAKLMNGSAQEKERCREDAALLDKVATYHARVLKGDL